MVKSYKNISKDELALLSRAEYESVTFLTKDYVRKIYPDLIKAANILNRLTKKGRLIQIERGKYFIVPLRAPNQFWSPNEFIVADFWMKDVPYYIGYFTMYNYWGLTEQISQKVFILNTKKSLSKTIAGVNYQAIKIASDKYYGTTKITIDGKQIVVSDKERTLVDLIFNPISSWDEVLKIYKDNLNKVDLDKLISYIIKFPVGSVRKRAGYILETSGCPDKYLNKIKKSLGNKASYDCFNPFKKTRFGTINKEWALILNG